MKKLLSIFLIFSFFYLMPVGVFAQEDVSVSVQNADESADIDVKILNVTSTYGEVSMELEVSNNTEDFIDTLNYDAEIYKGDELQDFGYRFGSVEYTYTGKGNFNTLNPGETKTISSSFSIPENIDEGNYFLRLSVSTKDSNRSALAYTETPFWISGNGGFLGAFSAFVDVDGERLTPDTGLPSPQSVQQYFEIPFEFNKKLEEYLSSGNSLKAQVNISSVTRKGEVSSQTDWYDLKDLIKGDSIFISLIPETTLVSGPYSAEIKYKNSSDDEIATNSYARVYIEGLTARISSINTSVNDYKKGQLLDLVVPVAFGGHSKPEVVSIESELLFDDGSIEKFTKSFSIQTDDQEAFVEDIDFSDEVIKNSGKVQKIIVTVFNSNGQKIALQDLDLNIETSFGQKTSLIFYLQLILILVLVILILLGIKRFFPQLLDSHKNSVLQLLLLISSSSILVLALLITIPVNAQPSNNDGYSGVHIDTFMDIWTKLPDENVLRSEGVFSNINTNASNFLLPSGEQESCSTGRDLYTDIYVRLRCAHCLNGVSGEVKLMSKVGANPSFSFDSPEDYKVFIHSGGGHRIPLTIAEGNYTLTNPYGRYTFPEGGNKISPQKAISGFQGQAGVYGPFTLPIGLNEDIGSLKHGDVITKTYRVWGKTYGGLHCTLPKERVNEHTLTCKVDLDICDDIVGVQTEVPKEGDSVQLEAEPGKTVIVGNITGPIVNGKSSICPMTPAEKPELDPISSCTGDKTGKVGELVSIVASGKGKELKFEWTNYSPDKSKFTEAKISSDTKSLSYKPSDVGTYTVDITATDKYGQKSNTVSCPVSVNTGDKTPDITAICIPENEKVYPGDDFTISTQATSNIPSAEIELRVSTVGFVLDSATQAKQTQKGVSPLSTTFTHILNVPGSYTVNYEANYVGSSEKVSGSCPVIIEEPLQVSCLTKASILSSSGALKQNGIINENGRTSISIDGELGDNGNIKDKVKIDWGTNVSGGEGPYTYSWKSLVDGANGNSSQSSDFINGLVTTYDDNSPFSDGVNYELRESKKISVVTVTDSLGNRDTATCSVDIDIKQDVCKNMVGIQEVIPEGYQMDPEEELFCVKDLCDNISGIQTKVPSGLERKGIDGEGNFACLPKPAPVEISCYPSNDKAEVGKPVTFSARVINGDAPFDFEWGKATEFQRDVDGRLSVATATFSETGLNEVFVTVFSNEGERIGYKTCPVNITDINTPPFLIQCSNPSEAKINQPVNFESRLFFNAEYKEYFDNTPILYTWMGRESSHDPNGVYTFNKEGEQIVTVSATDGVTSQTKECRIVINKNIDPEPNPDRCKNIKGNQSELPKFGDTYELEGETITRTVSQLGMFLRGENCYPNLVDFSTKVSCLVNPESLSGNGVVTLTPKISGGIPGFNSKSVADYDISWSSINKKNVINELNNSKKEAEFQINSASIGTSTEYANIYVTEDGVLIGSAQCKVSVEQRDICKNIDGIQEDINSLPEYGVFGFYYEYGVKKQTPKNGFDINEDGTCNPRKEFSYPLTTICYASPSKLNGAGGKVLLTPYIFGGSNNPNNWIIKWFSVDQDGNTISSRDNQLNQAFFNINKRLDVKGVRYAGYEVTDSVSGDKVQASCAVELDPTVDIECRHDKEDEKVSVGEPVRFTITAKLGTGTYKYRWLGSGVVGLSTLSVDTPTSFQTSFSQGGDNLVTGEVEFTNQGNITTKRTFTCPNVEIESTPDLCQNIDGKQWPNIPSPGSSYTVNGVREVVPPGGMDILDNSICLPSKLELNCTATPNTVSIGEGIVFNAYLSNEVSDSEYSYSYDWKGPSLIKTGSQASRVINQGDVDFPQTVTVTVYEKSDSQHRSMSTTCPFVINTTDISSDFTNQCEIYPRLARTNYPINLISKTDPDGSYEYKWSGDGVPETYTRYGSSFDTITTSFANPGIYNIESVAKKGNKEVSSICRIDVRGYPSLGLDGGCTSDPAEFVCIKGDEVKEVNWIGTAVGGSGEYTYRWTGAVGGISPSTSAKYTKENIGTKYANIFIEDGSQGEIQRQCSIEVLNGDTDPRCNPKVDEVKVSCAPSKKEVKVGERVDWILSVNSGGLAPYVFEWDFINSSNKIAGFNSKDGSGAYSTFGIEDIGKTKTARVHKTDSQGDSTYGICSVKVIPGENDIVCRHNKEDQKINIGDPVTYTIEAKLGAGLYKYRWSGWSGASKQGLNVLSSNTPSRFTTTFDTAGDNIVSVDVAFENSFGGTIFERISCPNAEVRSGAYKPVEASCGSTPKPVCVSGDDSVSVNWFGTALYGNGNYTYRWNGDVSGTGTSVTKVYTKENLGPHSAFFSVNDGTSLDTGACSVEILDADSDPRCRPETDELEVSCSSEFPTAQSGDVVNWNVNVSGGTKPYVFKWSGVMSGWNQFDGSGAWSRYSSSEKGKTKYAKVSVLDKNNEIKANICSVKIDAGPPVDKCPNLSGMQSYIPTAGQAYILELNNKTYTVPSTGMTVNDYGNCVPNVPYSVSCSALEETITGVRNSIPNNTLDVRPNTDINIAWQSALDNVPSGYSIDWLVPGIRDDSDPKQRIVSARYNLSPNETKIINSFVVISDPLTNTHAEDMCILTLVANSGDALDSCPNIDGTQEDIPEAREDYYIKGVRYVVPDEGMIKNDDGNCVPVVQFGVSCKAYEGNYAYLSDPTHVEYGKSVEIKWDGIKDPINKSNVGWKWSINGIISNDTQSTAVSRYTLRKGETRRVSADVVLTDNSSGKYATDTCYMTLIADNDGGRGECNPSIETCDDGDGNGGPGPGSLEAFCRMETKDATICPGVDAPYFIADEEGNATVTFYGSAISAGDYTYTYDWYEGQKDSPTGRPYLGRGENISHTFKTGGHNVIVKASTGVTSETAESVECTFFVAPKWCDVKADPKCEKGPDGNSGGGEIKEI